MTLFCVPIAGLAMMGLPDNFSNCLSVNTQNSPYCMSPMSHSPNPMSLSPHWGLPASMFSPLPIHHPYQYQQQLNHLLTTQHMMQQANAAMSHPHGLTGQNLLGIGQIQQHLSTGRGYNGMNGLNSSSHMDNKECSAYSSLSSASSSLSSPAVSPRNASPVNPTETNGHNMDFGIIEKSMLELSVSDRRAPGCEKKTLEMVAQKNLTPYDYEQKKMMAVQAIQNKPKPTDYRVPTAAWSGYGLSQTMPILSENTESEKVSLLSDS